MLSPAPSPPTLTLLNVQRPAGGDYQAVLTDSSGSVTSVVALVNVVAADIPGLTNNLVADYDFEHNLADSTGRGNYAASVGSISFKPTGRTDGSSVEFSTTPDGSQINYVALPDFGRLHLRPHQRLFDQLLAAFDDVGPGSSR